MLFAQQFKQQQGFGPGAGGANTGPPDAAVIILIILLVLIAAVAITIHVLFLLTLSRCLHEVHPRNRKMEPGLVWLMLVPCLNIVWVFFIATQIPDSLRAEFRDRRLGDDGDYGKSIGLTYAIMVVLGNIPYIGAIFGLVALVCFIMFWVKMAGYLRQLREDSARDSDDDYDDRPRRRLGGRDDDDYDRPSRRRIEEDDRGYRDEQDER